MLHQGLIYLLSKEFMTITVYAVDNLEVPAAHKYFNMRLYFSSVNSYCEHSKMKPLTQQFAVCGKL